MPLACTQGEPSAPVNSSLAATRRRHRQAAAALLAGTVVLLAGTARAHRPHTLNTAMATAPDFATSGRAWLTLLPDDGRSVLMRSDDFGLHWDAFAGPQNDDVLYEVAYVGETLAVIAEDGTIWLSGDEGGTWRTLESGVTDTDLNGIATNATGIFLASGSGLWSVDLDSSAVTAALDGSFRWVATSPTNPASVVAIGSESTVWLSQDYGVTFTQQAAFTAGVLVYSGVVASGRLVVGTARGISYLSGSRWANCGALPVDESGTYARAVAHLRVSPEGLVLAGTGVEAPFVSSDGCATWEDWDSPLDVHYGDVLAGLASPTQAVCFLAHEGGIGLVGGYPGSFWTDDEGANWTRSKLAFSEYGQGIAFSPDWPADPRILFTQYGGGIAWTDDGGESWEGSGTGFDGLLYSPYARTVALPPDWGTSGRAYATHEGELYLSDDRGETWTVADFGSDPVLRVRMAGDRLWTTGVTSVAYSDDGGASFVQDLSIYASLGVAQPLDLRSGQMADGTRIVVVTTTGGVVLTSGGFGSWRTAWRGTWAPTFAELWPPSRPTRIVVASGDGGVSVSDNGGTSFRVATTPPSGRIVATAAADDGTLFAATADGRIWRSTDGGLVWKAGLERIAEPVVEMAASPDHGATGVLLIGTYAGYYVSADGGESVERVRRFQRYETRTFHTKCIKSGVPLDGTWEEADECRLYTDSTHGFEGGDAMASGDSLLFAFSGDEFRILGPAAGDGSFQVEVDGKSFGTVSAQGGPLAVSGMSDGWHEVVLTATPAARRRTMRVDAVEALGGGEVIGF
ncbi:hypothetical protein L6R50_06405 [Myxococcota bacterium]|nr:hypothetical protein [Myxococcota bacterium]